MKVLLDTNFVLTCAKRKIDFVAMAEEMFDEKIEWVVPVDVLGELEDLVIREKMKVVDKNSAKVGLEVLENVGVEAIELPGKNPNVDVKIANYLKDKNIVLATQDKELKKRVRNRLLIVRGKKLEFV